MNLVDALGGCEAEHAVCTTYPFDPLFFSNYAIDSLRSAGVATPIVLIDDQQYETLAHQQELTSRAIGEHYYLEPVTVASSFHPKVTFLAGESACHVSVTSANLTLAEYTTAAQLGQTVTVSAEPETDAERPTPQEIAVTQDVRGFVDQLRDEYVSGRDARTEMKRAVEKTEWLGNRSPPEPVTGGFVHNLETSILTQVVDEIGDVDHATFFAPFLGSESTLAEIDAVIDADGYDILVSEGNTHIDPDDAIEAFNDTVCFRSIEHDTRRWIHAKGIIFEGEWGRATLYGSPNVTGQALLETAATGNLEAGLLHYESDRSASVLWEQDAFPARVGVVDDAETFDFADYSFGGGANPTPSLTLSDARVERFEDDEILTRFVAPQIEDGTTVRVESGTEATAEVLWTRKLDTDEEGILTRLPDSFVRSVVCLRLPDGRRSNYRQITTEPTAGTRRMSTVLRDGGRETVQPLVDETLFLGGEVAPGVLTSAVSRLTERYTKQEETESDNPESTDEDKDSPSPFSSGVRGISTSSRKPHLAVRDGMNYAEKRIDAILEQPPTVPSAQELVDHFENLWYYVTRGLIRSALSPQLQSTDYDAAQPETNLNVDGLHSICANRVSTVFESQYLNQITTYLNRCLLHSDEPAEEVFDATQLADTFVIYPAVVLTLMDWHEEAFVGRFEFITEYHGAMTTAHPLLTEWLIDGHAITERLSGRRETLDEQLSEFGDRLEIDISLPGELTPGLEILFYGFWFRELAETDADTFENEKIFDQYDPETLAEAARIALAGQDRVENTSTYQALSKGQFDPIVRLMENMSDPSPQLESLVKRAP